MAVVDTALAEGTVLEYATGSGEPIPVVLQDTEAVFGTKQRTVTDYDNLITPAVEAVEAVYLTYEEYDVDAGGVVTKTDYDTVITPAAEAVPAVYGTKDNQSD